MHISNFLLKIMSTQLNTLKFKWICHWIQMEGGVCSRDIDYCICLQSHGHGVGRRRLDRAGVGPVETRYPCLLVEYTKTAKKKEKY